MNKKGQVSVYIIVGLAVLLVGIVIVVQQYYLPSEVPEVFNPFEYQQAAELAGKVCDGGVAAGLCGKERPLFCNSNLTFTQDCLKCGCGPGDFCDGVSCEPVPEIATEGMKVYIVPVHYLASDVEFLERAGRIMSDVMAESGLTRDDFVIVAEPFVEQAGCAVELWMVRLHVSEWLWKREILLPGRNFEHGALSITPYRVFAIDKTVNDVEVCGCGYTNYYSDVVYVGGAACGRQSNIAMHELGHTFGLCDEYDTCVWEATNSEYPCRNTKPNKIDSDCTDSCCSDTGVCCYGKYSATAFSMMGSSDLPPQRELTFESRYEINSFMCNYFGVCAAGYE